MSAIEPELPEYHLAVAPGNFTVLRLDGRGFTRGAAAYQRPFDPRFAVAMRLAAEAVMAALPADLAHTASDEISLVLPPEVDFFGGRLAKWLSLAASTAAAALTRSMTDFAGLPTMDAKAFRAADRDEVARYLGERVRSSDRNCRNGYIHYTLRAQGLSARAADRAAQALGHEGVMRLLAEAPEPADWERFGAFLVYEAHEHEGRDPRDDSVRQVSRQRLAWREISSPAADLGPISRSSRLRG